MINVQQLDNKSIKQCSFPRAIYALASFSPGIEQHFLGENVGFLCYNFFFVFFFEKTILFHTLNSDVYSLKSL